MAIPDPILEKQIRNHLSAIIGNEPKVAAVWDLEKTEYSIVCYVRCTDFCKKYKPKNDDYLELVPGRMLNVIANTKEDVEELGGSTDEGEWFGECEGVFGLFPVYLTEMIPVRPK